MLVLTRKKEESIMIGSDIEVRVLDIRNDYIKLGFSAPQQVPIFRKEVFVEIQKENRLAASTDSCALESLIGSMSTIKKNDNSKKEGEGG